MSIFSTFIDTSEVYVDFIDMFVTCVDKRAEIQHSISPTIITTVAILRLDLMATCMRFLVMAAATSMAMGRIQIR